MNILVACEEQVVPPFVTSGGSSPIYAATLEALSSRHSVSYLGFDKPGIPDDYLRLQCVAHLIGPPVAASPLIKAARRAARFATGALQAPSWLEEFGRAGIKADIDAFIERVQPDMLMVHLYNCVRLIGQDVIRRFSGVKVIDIHDDFVRREKLERRVVERLAAEFPVLRTDERIAWMLTKHRTTRFSEAAARREELSVLRLFDAVLCANHDDFIRYSTMLPNAAVMFSPWPLRTDIRPVTRRTGEFSAGFIASNHPFQLEGIALFVRDHLPRLRRLRPDFTLAVAGAVGEPLQVIFPDLAARGVRVLGRVPNVADFYRAVDVVLVPLLSGTGVSVKTLEAMAYGSRVISTPTGVRGIPAEDRPNVTVCDISEIVDYAVKQPTPLHPEPVVSKVERYLKNVDEIAARVSNKSNSSLALGVSAPLTA